MRYKAAFTSAGRLANSAVTTAPYLVRLGIQLINVDMITNIFVVYSHTSQSNIVSVYLVGQLHPIRCPEEDATEFLKLVNYK